MLSRAVERASGGRTDNRRRLIFIAGLSLAVLAFALMLGLGLAALSGSGGGTQVEVVTATRDIGAREVVTSDALTLSKLPQSAVPPGALTKTSDARGTVALVAILQGQTITSNLVAGSQDQIASAGSSYLPIQQGYVAITLPATEQSGVGGYIAAGDYINIAASLNVTVIFKAQEKVISQTPEHIVTVQVFSNIHVIRVGPLQQGNSRTGAAQGVSTSITVVMSECDAQAMDWFVASGARLTYYLLSYKDYGTPPTGPDPACPSPTTGGGPLGPAQIDARFGFTKA